MKLFDWDVNNGRCLCLWWYAFSYVMEIARGLGEIYNKGKKRDNVRGEGVKD